MTTSEAMKAPQVSKGLKGVLAADSSVCDINGSTGKLLYRGYNIDDLAEHSTFEETAYLLFQGELPTADQLKKFSSELAAAAALPKPVLEFLKTVPTDIPPMTALRSAVSVAGEYDPQAEEEGHEANYRKSIRLTSTMATLVAAIHRLRQGKEPLAPRADLSFAGNFSYMLTGETPTADHTKAMDLILILHAEHSFNASTFAARVIAATLTDIYSAITGAIGALKGKLHGGANTEVLKTLMEVGSVDNVGKWVEETRAKKGKFMGFGHAVYHTEDPRAKHLKELSRRLGNEKGDPKWYEMSVEIEKRVVPLLGKHCNVDFYSASLQHYMGIPGELFTCIFAASRIVGWCAHVLEQLADNKIIRPSANYVGPEERSYVEVGSR
ncbi:MAG: citrate synthase [Planctomycetaceae bacterium]|nr:citrate synthase [Planctomycetaceae bacterium]